VADSTRHSELNAELASLRRQQLESSAHATYVGWTPESEAAHERRADRIAQILGQLAVLDEATG
jgi:hypothetical protein